MMYLTLIFVSIFVMAAAWYFYDSKSWLEETATINAIEMEVLNHSNKSGSNSSIDYKINLEYEFSHNEKKYVGTKLFPIIPNIFSRLTDAEEIINKYKNKKNVTVYFKPSNPNRSCLNSSKGISNTKLILLMVGLTVFLALFIWAFIFVNEMIG